MDKFYSGGFLYDSEKGRVLLHKRDASTPINPNRWAFFGGLCEPGETPEQCFIREIKEEIGVELGSQEVVSLRDYLNKELNTYRYVFFVDRYIAENDMLLTEGADMKWIKLADIEGFDLTEKTKNDLAYFTQLLNKER